MNKGHYYELIERFGDEREMAEEGLILDVSQQLFEVMEEDGVTKAELAKRLDCSKAYITKLLRGPSNMTLRKVAEVFFALGRILKLKAVPKDEETEWECVKTRPGRRPHDKPATSKVTASPAVEGDRAPRKRTATRARPPLKKRGAAASAAKKSG